MENRESPLDGQRNVLATGTFNSSHSLSEIGINQSELTLLKSEADTSDLALVQSTAFSPPTTSHFIETSHNLVQKWAADLHRQENQSTSLSPNVSSDFDFLTGETFKRAALQDREILIQAEDYSNFSDTTLQNKGGEYRQDSVDIQSTTDAGGGYNVGWIDDNEWLEYSVYFPSTTEYKAEARIASPNSGGAVSVKIDGRTLGTFSIDNTGGWQKWQGLNASLGSISAGNHTVRLQAQKGGFNLNWMRFYEDPLSATPAPQPIATPTLNQNVPPSGNFDLLDWSVSVPVDNDKNGKADTIKEKELSNGFEDNSYFYTGSDGGMVFRATIDGTKTSSNTKFTRSELREMLRQGNTDFSTKGVGGNNWVLSSAPASAQQAAGGVDGELTATLAVNHVTTTGDQKQVGRVIVGQIHANDDEPLRLYYRKLPGNSKGSIYIAHEPTGKGNEQFYNMIGSRSDQQADPADGIALGEQFSYKIKTVGNTLSVTIMRDGKPDVVQTVDMSNSGYDSPDQYMYFKAGAYNQNNTGKPTDYVQATFYTLDNKHNGYVAQAKL